MNNVPVSKIKVESKLANIRESLTELNSLLKLGKEKFLADKKNFAVAEHYLRRALEAVFDIAGHIVSRYPMAAGKRPSTYKGLALVLAEKGIVNEDFGKNILVQMAGYRNRMVHFYDEITPQEMYDILKNHIADINTFASAIVELLKNPESYNLTIED